MNCTDFEEAIELATETRTPLAQAAVEHANSCPECQCCWQSHCQLDVAIDAWKPVDSRVDLTQSVLAILSKPTVLPHSVMSTERKSRSGPVAIVCLVMCLLVVALFVHRNPGPNPNEMAKSKRPLGRAIIYDPIDIARSLTDVFSDLRAEYREIATETTVAARELANVIPRQVSVPALPVSDEFETGPISLSNDVKTFLNPIGNRVENALGFLWQAVPNQIPAG